MRLPRRPACPLKPPDTCPLNTSVDLPVGEETKPPKVLCCSSHQRLGQPIAGRGGHGGVVDGRRTEQPVSCCSFNAAPTTGQIWDGSETLGQDGPGPGGCRSLLVLLHPESLSHFNANAVISARRTDGGFCLEMMTFPWRPFKSTPLLTQCDTFLPHSNKVQSWNPWGPGVLELACLSGFSLAPPPGHTRGCVGDDGVRGDPASGPVYGAVFPR